jgi:hypothetical protein
LLAAPKAALAVVRKHDWIGAEPHMAWRRSIVEFLHQNAVALMRWEYEEYAPRAWSNRELRRFAGLFSGDVIHVSGWEDRDKEGGYYRDYFTGCQSYVISNFGGQRGTSSPSDIYLDLERPLPSELTTSFDVVFNHTTLEHVFDLRGAFGRLCELSKDIVIVVVPFAQVEHWEQDSFLDYWRVTEFALERLFIENRFEPVYLSSNHNPVHPTYFFGIGSRYPEKWSEIVNLGTVRREDLDRTQKFRPLGSRNGVLM